VCSLIIECAKLRNSIAIRKDNIFSILSFRIAILFRNFAHSIIKEHTKRINETTQDNAIHYQS